MNNTVRNGFLGLAIAFTLSACGGGGGDGTPSADPLDGVPAQATTSASGLVSYLLGLTQAMSEVREAIDLSALASLFTSEDTEPEVVQ
jgi:hypothetical protein